MPERTVEYRARKAAAVRRWEARHPVEAQERKRRSAERHREERNRRLRTRWAIDLTFRTQKQARDKRSRQRHLERGRRAAAARYARACSAAGIASQSALDGRWNFYGGRCWICGCQADQWDHVKPLTRGGTNWPANHRPACAGCNKSKGNRWPWRPHA